MKKIIFLSSLLVFIFSSCKKDTSNPLTSVSFEVSGTKYTWESQGITCALCGSKIQNFQGNYFFSAHGSNGSVEYISISLESSSLSVRTYTSVVNSPVMPSNAEHSFSLLNLALSTQPGDFGTVQITSIHNGYADGFFNAKLTLSPFDGTAGKVDIVNGEFKNVKIFQ